MRRAQTKEKQYQQMLDYRVERGLETLGLMTSQAWYDDPKRLTFTLARYKFAAKMLAGCRNVLEVGCADAFATRIVVQEVKKLTAVDFDPLFIEDTKARMGKKWRFDCRVHDMLRGPMPGRFDGMYALDVLEHITPRNEARFLRNMVASLTARGTIIIGMPSLESQPYASPMSKEGHVNCKTAVDLKSLCLDYFHEVFIFSMNDEVVHTGFSPMAHYLFAVCCGPKKLPVQTELFTT